MRECKFAEYIYEKEDHDSDNAFKEVRLFRLGPIEKEEIESSHEKEDEGSSFIIRFEKTVRSEKREKESSKSQLFDSIDSREYTTLDGNHDIAWEQAKLLVETDQLEIETDTKIGERVLRWLSISAPEKRPPVAPSTQEELVSQTGQSLLVETNQKAKDQKGSQSTNTQTSQFQNWSVESNFFIEVGIRKKMRAFLHAYDSHGQYVIAFIQTIDEKVKFCI